MVGKSSDDNSGRLILTFVKILKKMIVGLDTNDDPISSQPKLEHKMLPVGSRSIGM